MQEWLKVALAIVVAFTVGIQLGSVGKPPAQPSPDFDNKIKESKKDRERFISGKIDELTNDITEKFNTLDHSFTAKYLELSKQIEQLSSKVGSIPTKPTQTGGSLNIARVEDIPLTTEQISLIDNWYNQINGIVSGSFPADSIKQLPPGSVILDIGGNVGAWVSHALLHCQSCKIYTFEPVKEYAAYIAKKHAGNPNVHVIPAGIGNERAVMTLYKHSGNLGWNTLVASQATPDMVPVEIDIVPLDDWASATGFDVNTIRFIKIDVEGAEFRVIRGMKDTIKAMKKKPPIFIEIAWGSHHPNWEEEKVELKWLFDNGYQAINLESLEATTEHVLMPIPHL